MVTKIFQLLIFISPIAIGTNVNMDMFDIIFFRTSIAILFMASLIDRPEREMPEWVNKIILGLLAVGLWNIFVFSFAPVILHNHMNLFLGIIGFYIVYRYWDERQDLKKFILWAGVINFVFYISQRIGFDPVFNEPVDKMYSDGGGAFLGNAARLGTYFALIAPFMPVLGILGFIVGVLTRQYVICIPLTLLAFLGVKNNPLSHKIGFGLVLGAFAFIFRQHIYNSLVITRFDTFWKPALIAFFDKPLIGYGMGFKLLNSLGSVFNSYLQFIVSVGVIGIVWFGYTLNVLRKKLLLNKYSLPFISLALIALIEYPVEIPRLWILIIGIMVMALIKGVKNAIQI